MHNHLKLFDSYLQSPLGKSLSTKNAQFPRTVYNISNITDCSSRMSHSCCTVDLATVTISGQQMELVKGHNILSESVPEDALYLRAAGATFLYPLQCWASCCSSIQTPTTERHQKINQEDHFHFSCCSASSPGPVICNSFSFPSPGRADWQRQIRVSWRSSWCVQIVRGWGVGLSSLFSTEFYDGVCAWAKPNTQSEAQAAEKCGFIPQWGGGGACSDRTCQWLCGKQTQKHEGFPL